MKIEQADRISAASICAIAELRVQILAGEFDGHDYVQAFAKHRISERRSCVDFLRTVPLNMFDEGTIDAILAGDHIAQSENSA